MVVVRAVAVVAPRIADMVNLRMICGIRLAYLLGTAADGLLHLLPLLIRYFETLDIVRIPYFAIHNDRFHRGSAMRFEWSVDTAHDSFFGVEGAVLAARTTTFLQCDD